MDNPTRVKVSHHHETELWVPEVTNSAKPWERNFATQVKVLSTEKFLIYGKPKGGKIGYKQIAIGLLTNNEGCPIATEIFKGSTSDQTNVLGQVKKISKSFLLGKLTKMACSLGV